MEYEEWIVNAAKEIKGCQTAYCGSSLGQFGRPSIAKIISKHAKGKYVAINKDSELKLLTEECNEQRQTIALLAQQLADKREIIRKLTT